MAKKLKTSPPSSANSANGAKLSRQGKGGKESGFLSKPTMMFLVVFLSVFASTVKLFATSGPDGLLRSFRVLISTFTGSKLVSDVRKEAAAMDEINRANIPKNANPEGKPREATKDCIDRHAECTTFYNQGECLKNPGWMIINCPRSCNQQVNACAMRDPKLRCDRRALNMSTTPIYSNEAHLPDGRYEAGDMHKMFESLVEKYSQHYAVNVLSRTPWVVVFDNFTTEEEGKALVGAIGRWERSTDTGAMNEFGESGRVLSQGRTSSNGWCDKACEQKPLVKKVMGKIEEVTGVPRTHYESFQVLRYELNQHYQVHHDYGAEDVGLACGPRILTFFLYLSDVEEGGETSFPSLGISVKPKRGRAVLWPSVLDEDVEKQDIRTLHEAKPVKKGLKLAANSWLHLYEYQKPNLWGCTGSFDEL